MARNGLDDLFRNLDKRIEQATNALVREIDIEDLRTQEQPRKRFENLEALAASIREHGVLQPLVVRPSKQGGYEIVAGERRYRAARLAGLKSVPARVLDVSEREARLLALMENLQREDLNPYEETVGILNLLSVELEKPPEEVVRLLQRMLNEIKGRVTQNVLGKEEAAIVERTFEILGRMTWASFVQSRLPLLALPEDLKKALERGEIPYTAALELKKVADSKERQALIEEVRAGLTIRSLKEKVRALLRTEPPRQPWYRQAFYRLSRVNPERLPEDKRRLFERKLKELLALIEE